jgi:hypothetical protein
MTSGIRLRVMPLHITISGLGSRLIGQRLASSYVLLKAAVLKSLTWKDTLSAFSEGLGAI